MRRRRRARDPGRRPDQSPRRTRTLDRLARYLWHFKTTRSGKTLLLALLAATPLAIGTLDIPAHHLFNALGALCFVSLLFGLVVRPRLHVVGAFADKASAGVPVGGVFTITNRSRLPVYDLGLGFFDLPPSLLPLDAPEVVPALGPGREASLHARLLPARRGLYPLPPLRAYSSFPFGLFRSGSSRRPVGPLLVLPSFHPLVSVDLPVGARYQPGGVALTSNVGESPEYIGNRDFRPGDPVRRIDFRSWARLSRPVLREYQEEYYCRIALVLDTYVPPGRPAPPAGFPALEAAVSLAAAVADALSRGEYLIDIFAAGPELHVFRAGRHTAHFDNILEILACVDRCDTNPFEVVAPALADELGNISTVVCILLDWDPSRERLLRAAREAGCSVKAVVVRDGETSRPFSDAGGREGEIVQYDVAAVRDGGVEVL